MLITILLLLSAVPGIEAMWVSAYLICANSLYLVPVAIMINFIAVIVFMKIIDTYKLPERVERFVVRRTDNKIKRFEKWFSKYGYIVLFLLIALPLTGIGSYTGAFIGRVLGLKKHVFYISIFLGIAVSVVFAFLIVYGINIIGVKCQ